MRFPILHMILCTLIIFSEANRYCKIPTCKNGTHTLCRFTDDNPSVACGTVIYLGLIQEERDDILDFHNAVRERVHNGKENRGIGGWQPAAASFVPLEWDYNLELSAQRWANQCTNTIDICRNMYESSVGQSVKFVEGIKDINSIDFPIWSWYGQVDKYNGGGVKSHSRLMGAWNGTNEYTQMVWRNSKKIGCGVITYSVLNDIKLLLVCNYGPRGNVEGKPVY